MNFPMRNNPHIFTQMKEFQELRIYGLMTVLSLEESSCTNTKLKSNMHYQIHIHIKILRVGYVVLGNIIIKDEGNE